MLFFSRFWVILLENLFFDTPIIPIKLCFRSPYRISDVRKKVLNELNGEVFSVPIIQLASLLEFWKNKRVGDVVRFILIFMMKRCYHILRDSLTVKHWKIAKFYPRYFPYFSNFVTSPQSAFFPRPSRPSVGGN